MNRQALLYSVAAGMGVIGTGISIFWLGRRLLQAWDSSKVYESTVKVNEYMAFHYTIPKEYESYWFSPNTLDFHKQCAELCLKHKPAGKVPNRALEVGCSVGRSSFELAQGFSEVVGLDYSWAFVNKCQELKTTGQASYFLITEGTLKEKRTACIDTSIDRSRVQFIEGDACNLPELGQFSCVLAVNFITRISDPMTFLSKLPEIIVPGGILVLVSYYEWSECFTPKEKWLGGYIKDGKEVKSFDGFKQVLGANFELVDAVDLPFVYRYNARMFLCCVDHATVWRRRKQPDV